MICASKAPKTLEDSRIRLEDASRVLRVMQSPVGVDVICVAILPFGGCV